MYTIKQLSNLAGISVRTLHYYDEIGLLKPSQVGENGYRYYADDRLFRLQQILFFRELEFSLNDIKTIIEQPEFDAVTALRQHRQALHEKAQRLNLLIETIDSTIHHLMGEVTMSKKKLFAGFTPEEEEHNRQEARKQYDPEMVDASYKRWNSYSAQKKQQIMEEGQSIYTDLASLIDHDPNNPEVQQVIGRWHQHLRYFYEPTKEIIVGLGQLYVDSPDFANNFRELHPNLPEFMQRAITIYAKNLQ